MNDEITNIPKIRFKGYTEDWEQRKLGEVVKINGRIGFRGYTQADIIRKEDGGILAFSPTNIINNKLDFNVKNTYITKDKYYESPEIMVKNGDILFVKTGSTLGKSASVSNLNEEATINPQIVILRATSYFISEFISSYLISNNILKQVAQTRIGGAVPTLTETEIKRFQISAPKGKEQQKIGTLFKQLDDTIALHQRELDLLRKTKQTYLQKMFPKAGEDRPEIRFAGFTEPWEQRKLKEGMTEYTDRVYIQENKTYKQVSVKNIGKIVLRGEKRGIQIGRKRQAKVNLTDHPYTLIFTRQTIEQGGIGFAPKETDGAIVTENMPTIDVNNDVIYCNYLMAYVKTEDWYRNVILKNIEGGTAQVAIHEDNILSSEVHLPKIEEQQKIGTFFKQLDDTIALHQRNLNVLKEMKKSLLQQMFV